MAYQEGYGALPPDHTAGPYGGYGPDPGYGGGLPQDYGGYGPGPGGYDLPPEQYAYDHPHYDQGGQPQDVAMGDDSEMNQSYQQYTEGKGAPNCIDPENGIAPRRCTDCVCLFVFLIYVLGMIILVTSARHGTVGDRAWGDIRRLTHGHDYKGRLCGVDPGVEDKAFLYWCRLDPVEWSASPSKLNLEFPSCVEKCPSLLENGSDIGQVSCLFPQTVVQTSIQGGAFATVETYHVQFQQSVARTNPYETVPFGGRFCVPKNDTMKEEILHEPLRYARFFYSVGSLEDPWLVLFDASLLAISLGYLYLFMIKMVPRMFVLGLLYTSWILFTASGIFFLYAVIGIVLKYTDNLAMLQTFYFTEYMGANPFYGMYSPESATLLSVGVAAVLWCFGCGILGTITHVGGQGFHYIPDLIDAASECWVTMISMLIPPGVEAIVKFLLMWILAYNFMFLVSVGWYEERRLMVNENLYQDATAIYHFDVRILPWLLYYIFGWVWIMEITTSCGQFLISFAVISWYFMKKEGPHKTGVPPLPPVYGALDGCMYHAGSVCLGAAVIPWIRILRVFNWVEDESVPNEEAACCPQDSGAIGGALNACCKCIGGLCAKVTGARKSCCTPSCCQNTTEPRTDGLVTAGCIYRYSKNGYNDVIIRSQHYLQASQRAFLLIHKYDSTRMYLLDGKGCQVVTAIGVVSIGVICSMFTYWSIMTSEALTDPTSPSYIAAPLFVSVLAFFLCANIGYGFMMLFDHTADTLLYCYAWNKKFAKDNGGCDVEDYLPESLRDIVDADLDEDDGYCFYGQARPEMYLHTWLGTSRRKQMKDERFAGKDRQTQLAVGTSAGASGMSASQQGAGYTNISQNAGFTQNGNAGYYDPGYSSPGGYAPYGGQP